MIPELSLFLLILFPYVANKTGWERKGSIKIRTFSRECHRSVRELAVSHPLHDPDIMLLAGLSALYLVYAFCPFVGL